MFGGYSVTVPDVNSSSFFVLDFRPKSPLPMAPKITGVNYLFLPNNASAMSDKKSVAVDPQPDDSAAAKSVPGTSINVLK